MNLMNLDELTYYLRLYFVMGLFRGVRDELVMNLTLGSQVHQSSSGSSNGGA